MNSRERVLKALNHEGPDRVPVDLGGSLTNAGIAKKAHNELRKYLGLKEDKAEVIDVMQQLVRPDEQILKKFGVDVHGIGAKPPKSWKLIIEEHKDNYYCTDEWGIRYRMPKKGGYYFDIVRKSSR